MSRTISYLCFIVSTAVLSYSYLLTDYWIVSLGFIVLGLFWFISQHYHYIWFSSWALLIQSAAATIGIWLGFAPIYMAFVVLNGLLAWDLIAFHNRLNVIPPNNDFPTIERRHLFWLGITAVIGFLLSAVSGMLNIQLSFFLTLLIASIAALGTVQMISWLRQ
jgi:hypothetical protein